MAQLRKERDSNTAHRELRSLALPLSYLFGCGYVTQAGLFLYPYGNLTRVLPRSASFYPFFTRFRAPCPLGLTYVVVEYLYVGFYALFAGAVQGGWAVVPLIVERAYFRRLERSHGGEAII